MEKALVPPEHEKYCIDISLHGRTGTHYVTRRSDRIQKLKFDVTFLGTLFIETTHQAHPSMKNSVSMFCTPEAPKWTT
jgi:hypothetical protein